MFLMYFVSTVNRLTTMTAGNLRIGKEADHVAMASSFPCATVMAPMTSYLRHVPAQQRVAEQLLGKAGAAELLSGPTADLLPRVGPTCNVSAIRPVLVLRVGTRYGLPFTLDDPKVDTVEVKGCGVPCVVSSDQRRWGEADALIFHGPDLAEEGVKVTPGADVPGCWFCKVSDVDYRDRRGPGQVQVLMSGESASNYPLQANSTFVSAHFNFSWTMGRASDYPLHWFFEFSKEDFAEVPSVHQREGKILCLYSNCHSASFREDLITALMKALPPGWVDCLGPCLRNKRFPPDIGEHSIYKLADPGVEVVSYSEHRKRKEKLSRRYRYEIVFANSVCDFVDEKIFDAFKQGTIPIYYGGSSVRRCMIPKEKMAIMVTDFGSPDELADFLVGIDKDPAALDKYFEWRRLLPSRPEKLILPFHMPFTVDDGYWNYGKECHLCRSIVRARTTGRVHKAKADTSCCDRKRREACNSGLSHPFLHVEEMFKHRRQRRKESWEKTS